MPKLNNWSVVFLPVTPYTAPEACPVVLYGFVEGHPRFQDGQDVTTSSVVGKRAGKIVTKSGSEYELGPIDPKYEELFPGARERVFNTIPEVL